MKTIFKFSPLLIILFITGCSSTQQRNLNLEDIAKLVNTKSQLEFRQIQTKRFFHTSKNELMKVIINTLQDELYLIGMINYKAAVISATTRKDNLDLNIVTSIEHIEDNNFDIRVSLSIRENNKTSVLNDSKYYEYLFERIRKSLFLRNELLDKKSSLKEDVKNEVPKINHSEKKEMIEQKIIAQNVEKHVPNIKKKQLENKKVKIKKNNLNANKRELVYRVQLISAKNKYHAKQKLKVVKNYSNSLIKEVSGFYVVRVGKFNSFSKAKVLLESVKKDFPDAYIIRENQ